MGKFRVGELAVAGSRSCGRHHQSGSPLRRTLKGRDQPVGRLERAAAMADYRPRNLLTMSRIGAVTRQLVDWRKALISR